MRARRVLLTNTLLIVVRVGYTHNHYFTRRCWDDRLYGGGRIIKNQNEERDNLVQTYVEKEKKSRSTRSRIRMKFQLR